MTYMIMKRCHNAEGGLHGNGKYFWSLDSEEYRNVDTAKEKATRMARKDRTATAVVQIQSVFVPETDVQEKTPANFQDDMSAWQGGESSVRSRR